jgi:hypothetical protein
MPLFGKSSKSPSDVVRNLKEDLLVLEKRAGDPKKLEKVKNRLCSDQGRSGPVKCGLGSGSGFTLRARALHCGLGLLRAWPGGRAQGLACGLSPKTRPAWAFGLCSKSRAPTSPSLWFLCNRVADRGSVALASRTGGVQTAELFSAQQPNLILLKWFTFFLITSAFRQKRR